MIRIWTTPFWYDTQLSVYTNDIKNSSLFTINHALLITKNQKKTKKR